MTALPCVLPAQFDDSRRRRVLDGVVEQDGQQSLHGPAVRQNRQLAIRDRLRELQIAGLHQLTPFARGFGNQLNANREASDADSRVRNRRGRGTAVLPLVTRFFPPPAGCGVKLRDIPASPLDFRRAISASVRISEMGVRSSCEASAVNWVTRRKELSMRASISFNVSESRWSSSPVVSFSSRSPRVAAADASRSPRDCIDRATRLCG